MSIMTESAKRCKAAIFALVWQMFILLIHSPALMTFSFNTLGLISVLLLMDIVIVYLLPASLLDWITSKS